MKTQGLMAEHVLRAGLARAERRRRIDAAKLALAQKYLTEDAKFIRSMEWAAKSTNSYPACPVCRAFKDGMSNCHVPGCSLAIYLDVLARRRKFRAG